MVITFKGLPPHDLGPAELASARPVDGKVEMVLHVLDDWHSPTSLAVRVPMRPSVARALADHLVAAAREAEKGS